MGLTIRRRCAEHAHARIDKRTRIVTLPACGGYTAPATIHRRAAVTVYRGFVAKHCIARHRSALRPRLIFPCTTGNADDRIMKRLLLLAPAVAITATLAACGSSSGPARDASAPLVYVSSPRTATSIATCLQDRLSRVRTSQAGDSTELAVGADSNNSYFITLTPLNGNTVIKVMRPANAPNDPPEEELRFDIARCAT